MAQVRVLLYLRSMRRRGPLSRLRSTLAAVLGISSPQASDGTWWEIDLILVTLVGALALGVFAWMQM